MKRKLSVRVLALAVAGVVLSGAITVAAVNGSAYETLKRALFNVATYDNFTLDAEFAVLIDGEIEADGSGTIIVSGDSIFTSFVSRERHTIFTDNDVTREPIEDAFERANISFESGDLTISNSVIWESEVDWFSARLSNRSWHTTRSFVSMFGMGDVLSAENQNTARFRFAEAALDMVVGDLRNQMSMHTENGIRHISGRINHQQLPEIFRAGIDVIVEESLNSHRFDVERGGGGRDDYSGSPFDAPIRSINLDLLEGNAEVDQAGNLLYIGGTVRVSTVNVFGDNHVFEVRYSLRFSEIGTSDASSPIPGAVELFTEEFMRDMHPDRTGGGSREVFFTLNPDGTINRDSITTEWPGSSRWADEFWDEDALWDVETSWDEWDEVVNRRDLEAAEIEARRQELLEAGLYEMTELDGVDEITMRELHEDAS